MLVHIDNPSAGTPVDPLCFAVEGWIHPAAHGRITEIRAMGDGGILGRTRALALRPDVCRAEGLPDGTRTGFSIFCQWTNPPGENVRIELVTLLADGATPVVAEIQVSFVRFDHRTMPFGHVLDAGFLPIVHREHVYTSGPSMLHGSSETLALLQTHLPPPPARVLDVGCGLGYYGRRLRDAGYDWMGAEKKVEDCIALDRAGLPHRRVDGTVLPFERDSFDAALCIEVLEHIDDPQSFLREIARVAPRILVSVPNFETVSYLHRYRALPWHLLEADHKNFFTRWSLKHLLEQHFPDVEVACYHRMELGTPEGTPLYYNLFASATR